ncbi:tRNA pseudouridine synthase 3 [Echinococcus granulosus]|uniref:tRNA pseudouridine synthase n=1 Tax=Echinococcus granulosus TaxID=6210 RepID=W6UAJ5_ECHGR|nr:tRNA pseudouridine synthase 3 [Echinococcus granulosus]EUB58100.1 tRNA pseudouridine synthase 3 [Echinococcus granulosus]
MRLSAFLASFSRMSLSELNKLSHEELLARNIMLEGQVAELREQLTSIHSSEVRARRKPLDFSKFTKRRVALKLLYLGWEYSGLARQELNKSTIAEKLIEAFSKCRMIEESSDIGFAVCGRTDKGVSALSQVVALTLRSNVHSGVGVIAPEDTSNLYPEKPEVDYVLVGNKNLPPDIRILAWCPVPFDFNPRRDCISRSYKYFFPAADLNVETMRIAASKLIGQHDFRNFCSPQINNGVFNHERIIFDIDISDDDDAKTNLRRFCCLNIRGSAFLYHQIRCIASLLIAIGRGLESPNVIDALLDVQKMPGKPQYQMAEAEPLLFFEPEFQEMDWQTSLAAQEDVLRSMQKLWTKCTIRAQIVGVMLEAVESKFIFYLLIFSSNDSIFAVIILKEMFPDRFQNNYFAAISREALFSVGPKRKSILERPTDEALEEKIQKLEAKRPSTHFEDTIDG